MRLAKLCVTASILMASGMGAMAVEMVRPLEALEQSRRAMIELDKRQKREDAERQKREKEQDADRKREEAEQRKREREEKAQQATQRKRDAAAAKADQGARPSPANLPPQPSAAPAPGAQTAETAEPRRQPDISMTPLQQQDRANPPQPLTQPADPQVNAQVPTAPPQATGQAAIRRPQGGSEPDESRVGVNQGQGEPQGRVQSGSPPATGATPDKVPPAAPAAIAVSRLKRMNLHNERGDKLGDVERVVQSADGHFHIVIGAGGFLGIRERDVRIPLEQVTVRGDRLVIQDLTDDQMRIMPVFDRKDRKYRELARNTTVPISHIGSTAHP
jgi:sporulation protein YlmC with PRC-barrel domain